MKRRYSGLTYEVVRVAIAAALLVVFSGAAVAACVSPAGIGGETFFNAGDAVMQYCNGTDWVAFPKKYNGDNFCTGIGPWTPHKAGTATMLTGIAYGGGIFAAVPFNNTNGRTISSPDGVTWSDKPKTGAQWSAVTYGDGQFVAVAHWGSGYVMTSPDGINWTGRTGIAGDWKAVTYGNGLFVAIGDGILMTSPDGVTWTPGSVSGGYSARWRGIAYGDGTFVAVGDYDPIYSTDGENWFPSNPIGGYGGWRSIAYGNGLFVMASGNAVRTSPDGITWTPQPPFPEANSWKQITYGNGLFVAVGSSSQNRVAFSPDGVNWTMQEAAELNDWRSVAYGRGMFAAVAYNGENPIMTAACLRPGCHDPDAPTGATVFNTDYHVLQYCDGKDWQAAGPVRLAGPDTGCADPAGVGGNLVFNTDYRTLQYCDGSNWIAVGRPCKSCGGSPDEKVVFYTLQGKAGYSFGGVGGADARCADSAARAGLKGIYKAWIAGSDPASAPATRFSHAAVPYVRIDGIQIADDWADLTDGSLDAAIITETGNIPSSVNGVWTNVATDGTRASADPADHCQDWSVGTGTGSIGSRSGTSSSWTAWHSGMSCQTSERLFCFEQ